MKAVNLQVNLPLAPEASPIDRAKGGESVSFASVLKDAVNEARSAEMNAVDQAERFAKGDPNVGIHEVMIAEEKAAIGVRYAVTVKNKALEAYRELMSTPV